MFFVWVCKLLIPSGMLAEGASSERTASVFADYVSWQRPDRETQVYVQPEIVRMLSALALERRGQAAEIGGVLWGEAGPADSLIVADATLIPCSGSLFNATPADARAIQQVLLGRAPQASLSLAGYFRSSLEEEPTLTPQDLVLIRQNIHDPDSIFVVIKPRDKGICTASVFFGEDGHIQTEASGLDVPFIAMGPTVLTQENGAPEREEKVRTIRPRSAADAPAVASQPELSLVAMLRESAQRNTPQQGAALSRPANNDVEPGHAEEPEKRGRWASLVLGFLSICLLLVATGLGIYFGWPLLRSRLQRGPEPIAPLGVGLQAKRAADGQISLQWNSASPDILNAASGVLTIHDGRRSRKVNLDTTQLRSGKLAYAARSKEIEFRLELNTDALHTFSESVRLRATSAVPSRAKRLPEPELSNPLAQETASTALAANPSPVSLSTTAANASGMSGVSDSRSVPAPLPAVPTPSLVTAILSIPPAQVPPGSTYLPPRVLEEMMPETTPAGAFARIAVAVNIDPAGNVSAAHALKDEGPANPELAEIATAAAQKWRFAAATLNGQPVSSEYRITFAFHRKNPE